MFNVSAFFIFITLMAFTPGPNNLMSMGNASRFGFRKSFPFNLGILAGFSFVMLMCALASAALSAFIPKITLAMKIVGAAYMLWLAWQTFRAGDGHGAGDSGTATFGAGAFLQLVNPKIYVYGFTAMSSWIVPAVQSAGWGAAQAGAWSVPAMAVVAGLAIFLAFYGFISTVCWALFGAVISKVFTGKMRALNVILSLLLVYCAASLFF
jgi:threonine/homoserine/homoserine lactone efflux protein